jgi:hypothetical protein
VMVNSKEVHRASTNILCHHYICSHYKDGSLPVQEQNATDTNGTTESAIMCQIFNECNKYGFEIVGDGIYSNDVKLGEVGYTEGGWWVVVAAEQKRVACQSALEAVWRLAVAQTQLLNRRFEMLTPVNRSIYGNINELLN